MPVQKGEAGKTEELVAQTKAGLEQAGLDEKMPGHAHLPLLIHLREELVHVRQVFVLKEKALRTKGPWCTGL